MRDSSIPWPKKQRELHKHHFDSTICRDDDIVIATYGYLAAKTKD